MEPAASRPRSVTTSAGLIAGAALLNALLALIASFDALSIGRAAGGLVLPGLFAWFLLRRENWARIASLCLALLALLGCGSVLLATRAGGDVLQSVLGPLALVALLLVASAGLVTPEASRWFTGRRDPFLAYVVNKVGIQLVLVFGIVTFGFLAADTWILRLDLTEDQRFSISPASHRIAAALENPLTIRCYFSDRIPEHIRPYQRQIFDLLAEYEAHSNGKIRIERYDPLESTAAASEASNYGVRPVQLRIYEATEASAMQVYGGIVLIHGDRASEVINIAERYLQGYEGLSVLEYEVSSKIWELTNEKPKLGLTGHLTRESRPANPFNPGMPQSQPEFSGLRQILGDAFEVEEIDLDREELDPEKVPLLVIVRPREMSDVAVFRLDQYLMKGGRVLAFLTQGIIDQTPWGGRRFTYTPFKSGLDSWFEHHGVRVPNEFVCHYVNAVEIPVVAVKDTPLGRIKGEFLEPNWFWPLFGAEIAGTFDKDNPAVQTLKVVTLWWPHPVDVLDNRLAGKSASVLLRSHKEESWRWKDNRRIDRRDLDPRADAPGPSDLLSSPVAVALEGRFTSFYADRPVPPSLTKPAKEEGAGNGDGCGEGEAEEEEEPGAEEEKPGQAPDVLKESRETQLVVIGNAFFISDAFLGQGGDRAKGASLLAFNLVDWLARSQDLIALRAKRYTDRKLVDEAYEEEIKELSELVSKGEIDRDTFVDRVEKSREEQKGRWKMSRWQNILIPIFFIAFAGAIVWIVRAASRAVPPNIPPSRPPRSIAREDDR